MHFNNASNILFLFFFLYDQTSFIAFDDREQPINSNLNNYN